MEFNSRVKYAIEDFVDYQDDDDVSLAYGKISGFLSTRPNSHRHVYSEKVIKEYAPSFLGKFIVADYDTFTKDVTTHVDNQRIIGYIPTTQEIKYEYTEDGYLDASIDVVISKIYAKEVYDLFKSDNYRAVSLESLVGFSNETKDYEDGEKDKEVIGFEGIGITILGKAFNPSVPNANIQITQMSADNVKEIEMAYSKYAEKKTYKIDKSKDSMSDDDWGDIDKTKLREIIMNAKNRDTLVKNVYLLIEKDWEDKPSEALKYPVMQLDEDTFVYNRDALSSALSYAKKENETSVITKLEKIYKKLGLDNSEKMSKILEKLESIERCIMFEKITKCAVEIGDTLWMKIYNILKETYPDTNREYSCSIYSLKGIYEEDGTKFVIVMDSDSTYKIDFSYTEDELKFTSEPKKVEIKFDEVNKFSEEEIAKFEEKMKETKTYEIDNDDDKVDDDIDKDKDVIEKDADKDEKISELECKVKKYEEELDMLRKFKQDTQNSEKMSIVSATMSQVKEFLDDETFNKYSKSGEICEYEDINGWKNEVLASVADKAIYKMSQLSSKENGITDMGIPIETKDTKESIYD